MAEEAHSPPDSQGWKRRRKEWDSHYFLLVNTPIGLKHPGRPYLLTLSTFHYCQAEDQVFNTCAFGGHSKSKLEHCVKNASHYILNTISMHTTVRSICTALGGGKMRTQWFYSLPARVISSTSLFLRRKCIIMQLIY
jgi:hypothetical protein